MAKNQELLEIMDPVGQALQEAAPYDLQVEVMASTMQQLQKNPGMDISGALQNAMTEWDI